MLATTNTEGCIKVTTGTGARDEGPLSVYIDEGVGFQLATPNGATYSNGSTVLDECYSNLKAVRVQNKDADGWAGSILFARAKAGPYEAGVCSSCTNGISSAELTADGSTSCMAGKQCGISIPWSPTCNQICAENSGGYWCDRFRASGSFSEAELDREGIFGNEWTYAGLGTKVRTGTWGQPCPKSGGFYCAGSDHYGDAGVQAAAVKKAINNGGLYPGSPAEGRTKCAIGTSCWSFVPAFPRDHCISIPGCAQPRRTTSKGDHAYARLWHSAAGGQSCERTGHRPVENKIAFIINARGNWHVWPVQLAAGTMLHAVRIVSGDAYFDWADTQDQGAHLHTLR